MDNNESTVTVEWKCPHCGREWTSVISKRAIVDPIQKCKQCGKISNCVKPFNYFANLKKTGKDK